jgi:cell division protein FtsI (penicillin-binding protein 3)
MTPLQILTFYNAIANNGTMVRPRFVKEIRSWNKQIEAFDTEVIIDKIASRATIGKIQEVLKNIVVRGTGKSLYSKNFSMAGKTGTARIEYADIDAWLKEKKYVSSFAGYFPADQPKYSCIVVIHKPSAKKGYYGADVTGPVFKRIAQKIYTDSPLKAEIASKDLLDVPTQKDFDSYYQFTHGETAVMPNVKGMPAMDAIAILENLGLRVQLKGSGRVAWQSLSTGVIIKEGQEIILNLS